MKQKMQRKRARGGFTLVEMLVVLAIISVLAAILFGVFSGVRERSRQSVCASNLKQIGLAFSLYADDNTHFLPPVFSEKGRRVLIMWPEVVAPYTKSEQIYLCPTDSSREHHPGSSVSSYGYNQYIGGSLGWLHDPKRTDTLPSSESQIVRPSATIMMADSGTTPTEGLPSSRWPVLEPPPMGIGDSFTHLKTNPVTSMIPAPYARHQGRATLLWADGHVSALPIDAFYNAPEHKRPQDKFTGISPCMRPNMGCD